MRIPQRSRRGGVVSPWSLACVAALASLLLGSLISLHAAAPQVPSNTWATTGSMAAARSGASAVLLPNGYLLITGGTITGGADADGPTATAERYSVDAGSFVPTPSMHVARTHHASLLLSDGRVLVAGGFTHSGRPTASIEIYDPESNHWAEIAPLNEARATFAAVQTGAGGRVVFFGGEGSDGPIASVEVFDPASGECRTIGVLSSPRQNPAAASLEDGRVLIAGGFDGMQSLASADIYDPSTNTISAAPDMSTPREEFTATLLADGSVLMAGGRNGPYDQSSAELFDASSGTFVVLESSLGEARHAHVAIALPFNNAVLIAGGSSNAGPLSSAEIFTPWDRTFQQAAPVAHARTAAVAGAVAADGLVLIAGGDNAGTAELYGFATVKTDKADYAPGEQVTITGSGWQPGEIVTLTFVEAPYHDTHPVRSTTADSNGRIFNSEFAPDEHDIDIRFFLTARGTSQAGATFTDGIADAPADMVTMSTPLRVAGAPLFTVVGGTFNYDGGSHPATATATGIDAVVVPGTTSFMYSPGGDTPPTNAGVYGVTANFVSASPDYSDATGSATITINKIAPTVKIDTRLYTYDANPHPATAVAVGVGGVAIAGSFRYSYTPSGTPLNVGAYRVTADFTSSDANYLDASATVQPSARAGTWTTLAPMSSERYALATGVIGGQVYVTGGCCIGTTPASTTRLEVYDPAANTWTVKTPAPPFVGDGVYGAAAGAIGTKLFVAGGHGTSGNTSTVHVYDSISDGWTVGASMPAANGLMASAVIDGKLFVAGGRDSTDAFSVDTLWVYDPAAGSGGAWTARKSLPLSRDSSAAAVFNGKLYVVGGNRDAAGEPQAYLNDVDVYDPAADEWTPLAPLKTARFGASAQFIDGILYVFGGYGDAGFLTMIEAYDPRSNTWDTVGSMPFGRRYAASEVVNGTAYLFGGQVGRWFATNSTDSFVPDGALRITAATLTVTADDKVKPFGAPLPALTASYNGFVGHESIADITGTPGIFTDATSTSAIGTYPINMSRNTLSALNYVFKLVPGTLTVAKAATTTSLAGPSTGSPYDPLVFTAIVSVVAPGAGNRTGGVTFLDGATEIGNSRLSADWKATLSLPGLAVGTHLITAVYSGDSNFMTSTSPDVNVTIAPIPAFVTANDRTKTYGEIVSFDGTEFTATGFVNGDGVTSVMLTSAGSPAAAGVNTYDIVPGGAAGTGLQNYDVHYVNGTLAVEQAAAHITITGYDGVYDGAPHGLAGSATGANSEDLTSLLNFGATFTNAPGGSAHWTFAGDANHLSGAGDAGVVINQASASISITPYEGAYDGNPHSLTGSATGVTGEVLSSMLNFGESFTNAPGGVANWTFAGDTNYAPASGVGAVTISQVNASINITPFSGVYDGNAHGLSGSATGVKGENLDALLNLGATFTNVPGGTAMWTFAGDTNYRSTSGDAGVVIAARKIAVAADAQWKLYGSADPILTYHATDTLVGADTFTGALSRVPGENAGTYAITQGSLALSSNYVIAFASDTLTIGTATITVTADDKTKAFGADIPTLTASYSGFVNGENLTTSGISGTPALATTAINTSAPGVYPISAALGTLTALNYQFAFVPGTLTIQPAQSVQYTIRQVYDWTKLHQSGSTIPIRIQLIDQAGANVSSWRLPVHVVGIAMVSTTTTGALYDGGYANADSDFRIVGSPTSYMLNLKTTGLAKGTYNLLFTVGTDATIYATPFQIR